MVLHFIRAFLHPSNLPQACEEIGLAPIPNEDIAEHGLHTAAEKNYWRNEREDWSKIFSDPFLVLVVLVVV